MKSGNATVQHLNEKVLFLCFRILPGSAEALREGIAELGCGHGASKVETVSGVGCFPGLDHDPLDKEGCGETESVSAVMPDVNVVNRDRV